MTSVDKQVPFVATAAIRQAVAGHEEELLDALGINWRAGRPHISCPYPHHPDSHASWRWDAHKCRAFCTCTKSDSIFDVVMKVEGSTFEAAKLRTAELLGRHDLIRATGGGGSDPRYQATDPASLLNAPAERRDDALPIAYLAHRLGIPVDAVPVPSTPMGGLKQLGYYDPPPPGSRAKPKLVGTWPCAVFGTIAADGETHAHRIYLAPGGAGKADLGIGPDGHPRDPKKSAKHRGDQSTAGRAVLWGSAAEASCLIVTEGIETAAAVAFAMAPELAAGAIAVAAAISAGGIEAFQPYPFTTSIIIAADRDEGSKADGRPGSRRGERAARTFALRHFKRIRVAVALPGEPGETLDWLDELRSDGVEAVRSGLSAAAPFVPTQGELDELTREAARAPAPCNAATSEPEPQRRAIRVMPGDLADATAEALRVIASERDALAAVYVRGNLLMRPLRVRERLNASSLRRPLDALILRPVDVDWLRLRLAQRADFYVIGEKGMKPVDVPVSICRCALAAAPWDSLPTLTGIIEAPTILPNGTVIQAPGYDPETGLLLDPGATQFPVVPSAPTRADAEAALRTLIAPFTDFPFVDEPSRSVALAAVLTVLVRRGLRAAPLIALDAPKMGSGKTLVATVCSYIATGRGPYLMAQVADPTDERKRLLAVLLENPAVITIDNVEHPLRSDSLCIALTEPSFTDRLLGVSQTVTVATNCSFFATGNNLVISGDLSARALVCRIDPVCERPEERTFSLNLHDWVPAHRGELAAAALTVIKAYLATGEPKQPVPHFARFEDWQRLCRFPLTWLGLADPCATRYRIEASDPVRESLRALLASWHCQFGDRRATIKAAIEAGMKVSDLQTAMEAIAGEKGGINARRLGRFIAKHERRIEGGLRFERDGDQDRALCWRVTAEFPEFSELFSAPSREDKPNGRGDGTETERWGRNSGNSGNSAAPDLIEVEL
jgi:hypothetical protein